MDKRDSSSYQVIKTLRMQSWERAKGELHSLLATFWGDTENFDMLSDEVEKLIKLIDDNGLAE